MKTAGRAAVFVAAAVCLAACGGGGTGPAAVPATALSPAAAATSAPSGTATLTLVYPPTFQTATNAASSKARISAARTPAYVNPNGTKIRVWVDTYEIAGSPFTVATTADATQTLQIPINPYYQNIVDAVEYAADGTTILALGESGSNYYTGAGVALQITLTMQMNVTKLAVTLNSNGTGAVIITPSGGVIQVGPNVCSPTAQNVFYLFSTDPLGGFVTQAGYGGTVLPTISSFGTTPGTTIVTPGGSLPTGQYNISFDANEDSIQLTASSGNPAYTLLSNSRNNNSDLYYLTNTSHSITYSSVITVPAPPITGSATLSAACI